VASLLDVFASGPDLVMVWELIRGPDLLTLLHRCARRRVPEPLAARLFGALAAAVAAMHGAGFCHRDLKPENAVLDVATRQLKLIDFGLARAVDAAATARVGTPEYMAPEMITGGLAAEAYDGGGVDAWGLGVVLYVLLTGALPFRSDAHPDSLAHTLRSIVGGGGPRPGPLAAARASPAAVELVEALLARDPSARMTVAAAAAHPWIQEAQAGAAAVVADAALDAALAGYVWGAAAASPPPAPSPPALVPGARRGSLDAARSLLYASSPPVGGVAAAAAGLPPVSPRAGAAGAPVSASPAVPPSPFNAVPAPTVSPTSSRPLSRPPSRAASAGAAADELLGVGLSSWLCDLAAAEAPPDCGPFFEEEQEGAVAGLAASPEPEAGAVAAPPRVATPPPLAVPSAPASSMPTASPRSAAGCEFDWSGGGGGELGDDPLDDAFLWGDDIDAAGGWGVAQCDSAPASGASGWSDASAVSALSLHSAAPAPPPAAPRRAGVAATLALFKAAVGGPGKGAARPPTSPARPPRAAPPRGAAPPALSSVAKALSSLRGGARKAPLFRIESPPAVE